jgi:hypothetical protein
MVLECGAGAVLATITLRDVCDTVVVPGGARGSLQIVRRLALGTLPLWKRVTRSGIGVSFAPLVLLLAFLTWMLLLVLAFGLMLHALRGSFTPPLRDFGEALYAAGSALATIGIGNSEALAGGARAVLVAAGLCGLAVMTMAVTYLLQVQTNIAQRDAGVLEITTTAGQPPSALRLLERHADLDTREAVADVLRQGRNWCAAVLQSHASHPSLIYFRSAGTGAGWPAALGTMVDLALIVEHLLAMPQLRGAAVLMREQAGRLAQEVVALIDVQPQPAPPTHAEVAALCERLRAAGYELRVPPDADGFIAARTTRAACIDALSAHLGMQSAPLLGS